MSSSTPQQSPSKGPSDFAIPSTDVNIAHMYMVEMNTQVLFCGQFSQLQVTKSSIKICSRRNFKHATQLKSSGMD